MAGRVLYNGLDTGLSLDSCPQCIEYIKTLLPDLDTPIEKVSKNDKISSRVNKIRGILKDNKSVAVVAYGVHVQKMASIVEITKKDIDSVDQYNKLLSFEWIRPGKNELLDRKSRVPILVSLLSIDGQVPDIVKTTSSGFYKQ